MGTIELKASLHKIVDSIENEQLLRTLYDFLKKRELSVTGQLWNSLTEEQKSEVLQAYNESEDDNNLVDSDRIFKKNR